MWNKNIETFLGCERGFEESEIVLFGAPFDSTTSYRPGTRFASRTMRQESYGLETYSPIQDRDMEDIMVFDGGDLELPFGNPRKALDMIQNTTMDILTAGKIPCMLGGEHLVTLGAFEAVLEKYPDVRVIQFDAHADLREEYLEEKLSHACVIRRIWDLIGDGRIYQHGIRSGERTEFEFALGHTHMHKFVVNQINETVAECAAYPVYLTIDLDVLDPSIFPGTGTPEAGGVSFLELIRAIVCMKDLNIVGMDVNELAPNYDTSGVSTAVACKVLRELLLTVGK